MATIILPEVYLYHLLSVASKAIGTDVVAARSFLRENA
jgi:hypothetical protein